MGFYDEALTQVIGMLNTWNFAPAFPAGYTGTKAVVIMDAWPFDLIDNMLNETNGTMTVPVISVMLASAQDTFRSLGGEFGSGPIAGTTTYASRVEGSFLVSCWADQAMGGAKTCEALASQVMAAAFVYREGLAAFRHLRTSGSRQAYQQADQLWCVDQTIEGDALITYYS